MTIELTQEQRAPTAEQIEAAAWAIHKHYCTLPGVCSTPDEVDRAAARDALRAAASEKPRTWLVTQLLSDLRERIDTTDELESHPPIIVHKSDINRLRRFGMKHHFADSAITLRYALDCLEALDV